MQNLAHINDRITVLGMPVGFMLVFLLMVIVMSIINLSLGALVLLVFIFVAGKVNRETKNGNPDIIQAYKVYMNSPDTVEDTQGYFSCLITSRNNETERAD